VSELFERVVCGVDTTGAGAVAARLASRLTRPDGSLTLVSVHDASGAVAAEAALARARAEARGQQQVETLLLAGDPLRGLLGEIDRRAADVVVVGTHDRTRAVGIVLGSVATHLLHEAPVPVLIARRPRREEARWPRSLVVGVDGSPESAAATAAARDLAARFDARVRYVAATGDTHPDLEAARELVPELEELRGRAVDELHVLSEDADLVVVGNRGLRGLRALGSVSERVAHEARCSVLVVRAPRNP
jgi:nucleotide-binding universal stress UspA family protein